MRLCKILKVAAMAGLAAGVTLAMTSSADAEELPTIKW